MYNSKILSDFIGQDTTGNSFTLQIPMGAYKGFYIEKSGTSGSSVSLTDITDNIRLIIAGKQRVNIKFYSLALINKKTDGLIPETSGTTYKFGVYVPVSCLIDVNNPGSLSFNNVLSTTTNSIKVYGIKADSLTIINNEDTILEINKSHAGKQLTTSRLKSVFIKPSNPSRMLNINITSGNTTFINSDYTSLQGLNNIFTNETTTIDGVLLNISDVPEDMNILIENDGTGTSYDMVIIS